MRPCATATLSAMIGFLVAVGARAEDLDAVRALIGGISVRIEHKEEVSESEDGTTPPLKRNSWTFMAGGVSRTVRYGRYLNRPPNFAGAYPSLANHDMGIGLDGGPFGNWYRGNAIRVVLDGKDVLAQCPSDRIEAQEGANGHLRFAWELEKDRRLTLGFTVPKDGRAVFACVEIEPGSSPLTGVELKLTCYPGGFGPAYKQPSHRYVRTARASGDVPRDFERSEEKPYPVLPLATGEEWVFYGDRLQSRGSLALLVNRKEGPSGQVRLSNYGVSTSLAYPPTTRRVHLAFFAYSLENGPAEEAFLAGLARERAALTTIPFWTGKK